MAFLLISRDHPLRFQTEAFIQTIYQRDYGATLAAFPQLLLAATDVRGRLVCAAGFRDAADGYFSDCYLDQPIERLLYGPSAMPVHRRRIFEVSTLVSDSPARTISFIGQIVSYAAERGFEWAFFTATRRLGALLRRLDLGLRMLGRADPQRVADVAAWGRYYEQEPNVFATSREDALRILRHLRSAA